MHNILGIRPPSTWTPPTRLGTIGVAKAWSPKMQVTIAEAARLLGLSEKTVRRRVVRGELPGIQEATPQGYTWVVDVPDDQPLEPETETPSGELQALRELNVALRDRIDGQDRELDAKNQQLAAKDEQIRELHILLQHAQAALPAPRDNRSWWQRLWHRNGR